MKDPTVFQITVFNFCISSLSSIYEPKIGFKSLHYALLIALCNTTPNTLVTLGCWFIFAQIT